MRKLATIQKIYDIKPIPEKDRICSGKILGWNVIIGKDSFIENDLVVFCEIDSVFPQTATWSDLERVKYRIKTMKVNTPDGPVYGQGYCIPISKLEELVGPDVIKDLREGDEVTELLGITKYEAPDPSNNSMLSGYTAGKFPTDYIHKTDETRLASCFRILDEMNEQECVIRMKIDGTSWSALKIDDGYVVCSRNNMLKDPSKEGNIKSDYWDMFYKYPGIKDLLDQGFGLQCEMYGEGIQKNHLKMKGKHLAAFNIFDIKTRKYVDDDVFEALCIEYDIPVCPIVYKGKFVFTYQELEKMADTLLYPCGNPAEGIVIRPIKEQYSKVLKDRMSFKQISRVFLTKGGD